jgi:hypothetical protein
METGAQNQATILHPLCRQASPLCRNAFSFLPTNSCLCNVPVNLLFTHGFKIEQQESWFSSLCCELYPPTATASTRGSVSCCVPRCPQLWFHAGLYDCWKDGEESEPMHTCTILTTDASKNFQTLHDRMPVILASKEACSEWMSSSWEALSEKNWARYHSLCMPYSGTDLVWFPVTTKVRESVHLVIMTQHVELN